MCGRYSLTTPPEVVAKLFKLSAVTPYPPRYNIAPTQPAPVVRQNADGQRRLDLLRWGFVPFWAKDIGIGAKMINAKCETVSDKPAFRNALRRHRCLVPADAFYEWKKLGKTKQPYCIRLRGGGDGGEGAGDGPRPLFALAGLWDRWKNPQAGGEALESFTVLTTDANDLVGTIHDRMPVILTEDDFDLWLDPAVEDPARLAPLLKPLPSDQMQAYPVSRLVNSPANDEPSCLERVPGEPASQEPPASGRPSRRSKMRSLDQGSLFQDET